MVHGAKVVVTPTFVDYLRAGWHFSLTYAIDYTQSNKLIDNPESLHYIHGAINPYEVAMMCVGSIVEVYDADRCFPVLGLEVSQDI